MEDLRNLVYKFGSTQLKNIVDNLQDESSVSAGRTVIDYKLYDRIVINNGLDHIDDSNNGFKVYGKGGFFTLPQLVQFFNKTAEGRTLQALQLTGNTPRINNLVLDGKADEPFRFDRLAVDVEVYEVQGKYDDQDQIQDGQGDFYTEKAMSVAKQILESGKLIVNVNGRDLNYAEPLGFAGSSVAIDFIGQLLNFVFHIDSSYYDFTDFRQNYEISLITSINNRKNFQKREKRTTKSTENQKASVILLDNEGSSKTATTYSPTVTQYHRRDWA